MLSLAVWMSTSISVVRVSSQFQMLCRILERNESVIHSHSFNGLQSLTKVFEILPTLPASCLLQCCLTQSKWDSMLVYRTNTTRYEGEVSPILRTVFQHFFTDCGFSIFGCYWPIYTVRQSFSHATSLRQANYRLVSCESNQKLAIAYDFHMRHKKCRRLWKHFLKRCDNRNRIRQKLLNILSQISRGRGGRRSFLASKCRQDTIEHKTETTF